MRAHERTDERVAQYLRLDSLFFQTTVDWRLLIEEEEEEEAEGGEEEGEEGEEVKEEERRLPLSLTRDSGPDSRSTSES